MTASRRIVVLASVAVALTATWLVLAFGTDFGPAQRRCLVHGGAWPMLDWNFVRLAADFPDAYVKTDLPEAFPGSGPIERADICNPPLPMLLVRVFPATFGGGLAATAIGAFAYLAAAAFYLRRRAGIATGWAVVALAATLPFLFAVQVGNVILYAAAAGVVFLAFCDSESRSGRIAAALALAFAFAVKISPAALGVLYFAAWRKQWRYAALAAAAGGLLLTVPFAAYGGVAGFAEWLACAAANTEKYEFRNVIGLYGVFYALGRMLGRYPEWYASAHSLVHALSAVMGAGALAMSAWRKAVPAERAFLAAAGMLMLPPTMMIYTLLFVLPAILALPGRAAALTFVALACPLQVFVGENSLLPLLSAVAFLVLVIRVLVTSGGELRGELRGDAKANNLV